MKFLRAVSPVGLDIGPRSIAAAQLSRRKGVWRLETAGLIGRPIEASADKLGPDEAAKLADVLSRQGFEGDRVVLAVPESALMLTVLDLPPRSSGAPLDALARVEMARTHRREPGSFELACWDLPAPLRATEATSVMGAACAHDAAGALLSPLENAGLTVQALDIRAWAMARACQRLLSGYTDVAALLHIGEAAAVLALVRQGIVVYERTLPEHGLAPLRARIADELSLEPEYAQSVFADLALSPAASDQDPGTDAAGPIDEHTQGIVRELRAALAYAMHRYGGEVARVCLLGPGAPLRGLCEALAEELSAPAQIARPTDLLDCAPSAAPASADPALAVAVGLAQHGAKEAA